MYIFLGICDHTGKFIDIYVGSPGRMHDSRVFRNSPLFGRITGDNGIIPPQYHLLGDAAYPLLRNLMTPFRDTGHLTVAQVTYNTTLSTARSIIERAFGLLKGKFRRLKYLDIQDFELGNHMIAAACVLHNFILEHDNIEFEDDPLLEVANNMIINDEEHQDFQLGALEKRNGIVTLFQ